MTTMLVATKSVNTASTQRSAGNLPERNASNLPMLSTPEDNTAKSDSVEGDDFYQKLQNFSNTIISIQYNATEFLTFKVWNAQQGRIVRLGTKAVGLQCRIDGKLYTFNREHLDMMSKRECNELFQHLGIDGSQLFQD